MMKYFNAFFLLANTGIPIYVSEKNAPCFRLSLGAADKPIFVFTIPKSGTYLLKEIMEELEGVYCGQFSTFDFFDQRFGNIEDHRLHPSRFIYNIDISVSSRMIRDGQFGVGHIPPDPKHDKYFRRFYKLFCYRNLRNVVVSATRYHHKINRGRGVTAEEFKVLPMGTEKVKKWLEIWGQEYSMLSAKMIRWMDEQDVLSVRFETLVSGNGIDIIRKISKHIGHTVSIKRAKAIADNTIGKTTVTSSGDLSDYRKYWSDDVETLFQEVGFGRTNTILGYDNFNT